MSSPAASLWSIPNAALCVLFALAGTGPSHAQTPPAAPAQAPAQVQIAPAEQPVNPQPPVSSQPPSPSASRPGLIDAISGWMKDSVDGAQKSIEGLNERVGEANRGNVKAAKDAVEGMKLPGTNLVTGRTICPVAANGAPDCTAGSNKLCSDKGFGAGKILATETAQNCPARVLLSGRAPKEGDCRMDTYVTQAVCQ
jgi:hypothetical protein